MSIKYIVKNHLVNRLSSGDNLYQYVLYDIVADEIGRVTMTTAHAKQFAQDNGLTGVSFMDILNKRARVKEARKSLR